MTRDRSSNSPFDRLPEPYRTRAKADRDSALLEGLPCTAEDAVQATERYLASGGPERMIEQMKRVQARVLNEGKDYFEVLVEEDRKLNSRLSHR